MACAFSIAYCNAKPVPIDVKKDNWIIDTSLIEEKINKKTKAIMVVHLFGHTVDMDIVMNIAKKYDLKVIEDCAEAHGVEYKNKKLAQLVILDVSAFSLIKQLPVGKEAWSQQIMKS